MKIKMKISSKVISKLRETSGLKTCSKCKKHYLPGKTHVCKNIE